MPDFRTWLKFCQTFLEKIMIKTIIYRTEGVILNEELVRFRIYEKLWYYLRQNPRWQKFESVLKLRESYISRTGTSSAYQLMAMRYLSDRVQQRFQQELQLFLNRLGNFYIRTVPGMLAINTSLNYYYRTVLIANRGPFFEKARRKLGLNFNFNYIYTRNPSGDENSFRSLLQEILQKTRSTPEETIMITDRMIPDITAAKQLRLHTILTRFDLKTAGFMPQSNMERQYAASVIKIPENAGELTSRARPDAIARDPLQVVSIIQSLEEGRKTKPQEAPENDLRNITLWDIARQVLGIPEFEKHTSAGGNDQPPYHTNNS
jgi:FMN phosphatase YigB (HAD superfamily)